jgi:hypothetical protein
VFSEYLRNHSVEDLEVILLGSGEYYTRVGGGTDQGFLQALYRTVLGRDIEAFGLDSWGRALATPGWTRERVARAILASGESNGREVDSLFQAYLRRGADPTGLEVFGGALGRGARREAVAVAILTSGEYGAPPGSGADAGSGLTDVTSPEGGGRGLPPVIAGIVPPPPPPDPDLGNEFFIRPTDLRDPTIRRDGPIILF